MKLLSPGLELAVGWNPVAAAHTARRKVELISLARNYAVRALLRYIANLGYHLF